MDATNAMVTSIAGVIVAALLAPILFRLYMSYVDWAWKRLDGLATRKNKH